MDSFINWLLGLEKDKPSSKKLDKRYPYVNLRTMNPGEGARPGTKRSAKSKKALKEKYIKALEGTGVEDYLTEAPKLVKVLNNSIIGKENTEVMDTVENKEYEYVIPNESILEQLIETEIAAKDNPLIAYGFDPDKYVFSLDDSTLQGSYRPRADYIMATSKAINTSRGNEDVSSTMSHEAIHRALNRLRNEMDAPVSYLLSESLYDDSNIKQQEEQFVRDYIRYTFGNPEKLDAKYDYYIESPGEQNFNDAKNRLLDILIGK